MKHSIKNKMNYNDLLGTWFEGTFESYKWRCFCFSSKSFVLTDPDADPYVTHYTIKFFAEDMNGQRKNIGAQDCYGEFQLEYMNMYEHEFKRMVFEQLFSMFLTKYVECGYLDETRIV